MNEVDYFSGRRPALREAVVQAGRKESGPGDSDRAVGEASPCFGDESPVAHFEHRLGRLPRSNAGCDWLTSNVDQIGELLRYFAFGRAQWCHTSHDLSFVGGC